MRSGILSVLFVVLVQVHADTDVKADGTVDKLFGRVFNERQSLDNDLDNVILGKSGSLALQSPSKAIVNPLAIQTAGQTLGRFPQPIYAVPGTAGMRTPIKQPPTTKLGGAALERVPKEWSDITQSLKMARNQKEKALEGVPKVPYKETFFVHGGEFDGQGLGSANMEYMESRMRTALEHCEDMISEVDTRLTIEGTGTKQRTYHMEVTVKTKKGIRKGHEHPLVLSSRKNDENTFVEAVDHMHDTLKRAMRRVKEKHVAKLRHQDAQASKAGMFEEDFTADTLQEIIDEHSADSSRVPLVGSRR